MGSASYDDSSQKALEGGLVDTGERLLAIPSSTDELLILLEKAESLLAKVRQQPPRSTCHALLPAMKALITDDILRHADLNVQVAVASCFNKLTRITAPDPPYNADIMMVFFRLYMIAFKQLSCESSRNYSRALQIIETMAEVRSSLILLDIDTDGLIVEIFQLFLDNIRSEHPSDVFKYMEKIMTLVIEESGEISSELLKPLLSSVKMDNKNTSPISWELGKKVFENCATKLQAYLREAVKEMNLDIDDYAEIVTSLCRDTSNGKNTVSKEVAATLGDGASQLDGLSKAVHEDCAPETNDGNGTKKDNEDSLEADNENSLETLKSCQQSMQSGMDTRALQRRRGRKPNSVIKPEEGCEHKAKERGHNVPKKRGKEAIAGSSTIGVVKKEWILVDTDTEGKHELLPREQHGRKEIMEEVISQKNMRKDGADKMEEFPMSKPAEAKYPRKEKEKKSKRSRVDYGEELVNLRIQVWWPMDKMFYPGTVKAFDPVTKKHTIIYDDNEIEILNMRKETWELLVGEQPQKQEADHPSPTKVPIKTQEKTAKRKAGPAKKQHAASSSKSCQSKR